MSVARHHLPVRTARSITRREVYWILALGFFVIGDLGSTIIGLRAGGFAEVGPLARPTIGLLGVWGLVGIKAVSLGLVYGVWLSAREPTRVVIPLVIAAVGGLATGWNFFAILVTG